jgi:CMP-N-acetylneuraminic acid synthetase
MFFLIQNDSFTSLRFTSPLTRSMPIKHSIQFYNRENGYKRCWKNCALCKHLIESSKVKDNKGKIYNIHGDINCKTTSIIYCIFCTKCDTNIYVGQTGTHFTNECLYIFRKFGLKKPKILWQITFILE